MRKGQGRSGLRIVPWIGARIQGSARLTPGDARRGAQLSAPCPLAQPDHSRRFSSLPISEGLRVTVKPHSSMMASLASAVSAPPEINAPA
jgi:hypothetical protein